MSTGIITGWVILFAMLFVSKKNHIFELNATPEDHLSESEREG
ncbi:MAG: hypothetical protein PHO65_04700 [Sulfurovum sp.]|nr:hypothetical protein [Sulfurovum sp.]